MSLGVIPFNILALTFTKGSQGNEKSYFGMIVLVPLKPRIFGWGLLFKFGFLPSFLRVRWVE